MPLTSYEAAEHLGVTRFRVYQLIKAGKLVASKKRRDSTCQRRYTWIIDEKSVAEYDRLRAVWLPRLSTWRVAWADQQAEAHRREAQERREQERMIDQENALPSDFNPATIPPDDPDPVRIAINRLMDLLGWRV